MKYSNDVYNVAVTSASYLSYQSNSNGDASRPRIFSKALQRRKRRRSLLCLHIADYISFAVLAPAPSLVSSQHVNLHESQSFASQPTGVHPNSITDGYSNESDAPIRRVPFRCIVMLEWSME